MAQLPESESNSFSMDPFEIVDSPLLPLLLNISSSPPAHLCSSRLLHLSLWFIALLDLVIALLALAFNALLTASALAARPIPFQVRRSLSVIAVGYAFLAGVLFAKKAFWLYSALSAGSPCLPLVSSIGCKLQEFPVLVVLLHALACPLVFAVQMCCRRGGRKLQQRGGGGHETEYESKNNSKRRSSTNHHLSTIINHPNPDPEFVLPPPLLPCSASMLSSSSHPRRSFSAPPPALSASCPLFWVCSSQQIALIVACAALAFAFTAFDQEPARRKVMVNCSLPLAIRQKGLLFALLTLVLCSQLVQTLLWQSAVPVPRCPIGAANKKTNAPGDDSRPSSDFADHRDLFDHPPRPSLHAYLVLSLRDLFLVEAILWTLVSFFTGFVLFQQFILTRPCGRCTRLLVELCFTTLPLAIALFHPILSALIIAPVSYAAQRLCPILSTVLPAEPPVTPPLPRAVPTVRILITEH